MGGRNTETGLSHGKHVVEQRRSSCREAITEFIGVNEDFVHRPSVNSGGAVDIE